MVAVVSNWDFWS